MYLGYVGRRRHRVFEKVCQVLRIPKYSIVIAGPDVNLGERGIA